MASSTFFYPFTGTSIITEGLRQKNKCFTLVTEKVLKNNLQKVYLKLKNYNLLQSTVTGDSIHKHFNQNLN